MKIPYSYIWRSLWTRRLTTLLTLLGVTLVIFVFAAILPWKWFTSSVQDSIGSVVGQGALILKTGWDAWQVSGAG